MTNDNKPPMFRSSSSATLCPACGTASPMDWCGLAMSTKTLTEKIQRQDRFIAELQGELQRARQASVAVMLGQLRLREAVLLYVGQDANNFAQQIAENFDSEVARSVSSSLFVLDNAPVPPEARDAIRKATNHGMNRW